MRYYDLEVSNEMMVNERNWSNVHNGFHRELTQAVADIISTSSPGRFYRDQQNKEKITSIIKKYTNISVRISSEYKMFAMMPPDLNKNHTLFGDRHREYFKAEELKKRQGEIKASVDLASFKVGGDFKTIDVLLFLDPELMWGGLLTAGEISAIILHEVGHMFSYFALAAHTYSINLPLLGTVNKLAKTEDSEKIEMILKEWNEYDTTLTKVETKTLSSKKKEVIVTAMVANQIQDTKSIMTSREYEEVNAEHLADKFAVRVGAGKELATGLNKLFQMYGSKQTSFKNFIMQELFLGFLFGIFAMITIVTLPTIIFPLLVGLPVLFGILQATSNAGDGVYDTEINRLSRMRDDMVTMLKDREIDKGIGQRVRDDIKVIDTIIKGYTKWKSPMGLLVDVIFPNKRRLMAQTEFYRELEKLTSNNLFLAAYDLRNL